MPVDRHIHCTHCDYDLFGLESHTCPECGMPFDPADASTYSERMPRERCAPIWLSALISTITICVAFVAGFCYGNRFPGGGRGSPMVLITVPLTVFLCGFVLRYVRLSSVGMLWGAIPIEFLAIYAICQLSGVWELNNFTVAWLVKVNLHVILPWLLGIGAGMGFRFLTVRTSKKPV